jgi:zinc transport system substrate-binding protein
MDTKRLIIFGGIIAAIVLGVSFFSPTPQSKEIPSAAKPMIAVSTFALYEIANAVAGDAVKVHPIIPLGTDAHMFTPNPSQVADISKAALLLYNGAGFESWAGNLKNTLPATTHVVDMSQNVVLLKSDEHHGEASDGEHHH